MTLDLARPEKWLGQAFPPPAATGVAHASRQRRGRFSGARLWRFGTDLPGACCLRRLATGNPDRERLLRIHPFSMKSWLCAQKTAGLSFVPTIVPNWTSANRDRSFSRTGLELTTLD